MRMRSDPPFDDVKKGERHLGYYVLLVLFIFWLVFSCIWSIWTYFVFCGHVYFVACGHVFLRLA